MLKFSQSTRSLLALPGMKLRNLLVLMVAALPLPCVLLPHHPDLQSANSTDTGSDFGTMQRNMFNTFSRVFEFTALSSAALASTPE